MRLGDQGIYLDNAARILKGQVIYRDFFQFTTAGTEVVFLILFELFGIKSWAPNLALLALGLGLFWVSVMISRRLLSGWKVYVPGLLFLVLAFRPAMDATNRWFSALAAMSALATLIPKRTMWRVAVAGAFCGLAADFTQTCGPLVAAALAMFLLLEGRGKGQLRYGLARAEMCLFGGFVTTSLTFNGYFAWKAGLRKFVYCTVVYPWKYFQADQRSNTWQAYFSTLPPLGHWGDLPKVAIFLSVHLLVPLVYILFLVRFFREAKNIENASDAGEAWRSALLVCLVGLFMLLGVATSPSWLRLCSVSMPAFIVLVFFLSSHAKVEQVLLRMLAAAAVSLAIAEPIKMQFRWKAFVDFPSGRAAFTDSGFYREGQWLSTHVRESDYLLGGTDWDVFLRAQNPSPVSYLSNTDYTRPQQVREIIEGLEIHRTRFVLWPVWLDLPQASQSGRDHLGPVRAYLRANYHVAEVFQDSEEVWERNP